MSICDHLSVGVLVQPPMENDKYLMIQRARPPFGIAPPAGHIDNHGSERWAAHNEVFEETGLRISASERVTGGLRGNRCRRISHGEPGHFWTVYVSVADVDERPQVTPEALSAEWYTIDQIEALVQRTIRYARGEINESAWQKKPGIEPVWVWWLQEARIIKPVPGPDLALIEDIACAPPPTASM